MEIRHVFEVTTASPERTAALMADRKFSLDGERAREGVVSSELVVLEDTPERFAYELRTVERKRNLTGGFDKDTLTTVNRSTWNRKAGTLDWVYLGQESERVHVSGTYFFRPAGTGTRVEHKVVVEVSIPLLGGTVAKAVAKGFEKSFPDTERRVREALALPVA
jgi:hypothetical protein